MNPKIIGSRIKALITINNVKRSWVAKQLGISYNTLTKKLNSQREFNITEILKIVEVFELDLALAANVFFNPSFLVSQANKKRVRK